MSSAEPTEETDTEEKEPIVELEDIRVTFEDSGLIDRMRGEGRQIQAVDGVSLTIYKDEVIALVGESGCGKTTLGKVAVGLQRPTEGRVLVEGQDFWKTKDREDSLIGRFRYRNDGEGQRTNDEMRRALQIIHQDPGSSLNPNYTVRSLLSDPLKRWQPDLSASDREARIHGLLDFVGMQPAEDFAGRYPHQLSGGEQQRVALLRTILMNPELVLADEAISALDVSLRVEVMDLLLELQRQIQTSFLYVSHDISNARYLAEKSDGRIGVMYLGELVEIGTPEQIINNPQHPYTQVLMWATPDMFTEEELVEPPVRSLDIPDPADPPTGCRFHTRCPRAREVCRERTPETYDVEEDHEAKCYRVLEDHEYWDSPPIED